MMNDNPDPKYIRRYSDEVFVEMRQKVNDFIERYDRDQGALNEWRKNIDIQLKEQDAILKEISPAYMKGKWIAGLVALGSVGIAVKSFWSHITWH